MTKLLAISSTGGHWVQLLRLAPAWDGCEVHYATSTGDFRQRVAEIAAGRGQAAPGYHVFTDANRWQKLRLVRQMLEVAGILLKVRPDVIITTGASAGYFAIRLGKLLGARTCWLDSIANAEELSLSGAKAGPHADLWLTQWPGLAKPGGPQFKGAVL
jgi:UDP-N-acetylglucosamine:LPS N-acetylglucosamine transferase